MSNEAEQQEQPQEKHPVQVLLDQWEMRPRRQLDYGSVPDLEWLNGVIKSLIKACPAIAEKFGMTGAAPIVLEFQPRMAPGVIPAKTLPLTTPTAPPEEPDASVPSNAGRKGRGRGRSTRTPKESRKKAGTASSAGRKAGTARKPEAAPATGAPAPAATAPAKPSSPVPPAIAKLQSGDPPPPKLEPIG